MQDLTPLTTGAPGRARWGTILIVEDSPVQTELLRRALEGSGYKVIAAGNGAEGLAQAKAHRPAAVVSDINMPLMDGYAMCQAMRSDPSLKLTPVILLTMLTDPQDVIRGLNAGADAYLTKPYNIPALVARIEALLAYPPPPPPETERRKVAVRLAGETHLVDAHGPRMLNLLISTYENAVLQNRELTATEQALENLNQHLEQRVREASATLEQRVRERTAQLEAANNELDAFSYSVSHDLRAPLQTINGFSQALLDDYAGKLDAEACDYLQRIRGAALIMAQLVDDLLQLSRASRADMEFETVDLGAIAAAVADGLRTRDPERAVAFDLAADAVVHGDGRLLAVLLVNLLGNAWKFSARRAQAHIAFGRIERDGERVYFVRDDGAGFDMARTDKLFTPFQRLHAASEFPGTGVGLSLARRIVQRHGGRIWAEAVPEKGATFYFTLPGAPA